MCVAVKTWRKHDIAKGMSLGRAEGMELGRAEGMSLGRAEGMSLGRAEEKRYVVESALRENLDIELIRRLTGLSAKEIESIRETHSCGQRD